MARTSNTVWNVVLIVLGLLGLATAVFGPSLYREGSAFVAPLAELAGAEKAMPEATGVSLENRELLWRHRERIAAVGDPSAHPLHGILREGEGIVVTVDDEGQPVLGPPAESPEQG